MIRYQINQLFILTALFFSATTLFALPQNPQVQSGDVHVSDQATKIHQSSQHAIINWDSFDIAPNESVEFIQPNANATLLNRIFSQSPSQILGTLKANGRIFLSNPNGIIFGPNAIVQVGSLFATSLSISDENFLQQHYHFRNDDHAFGVVQNLGTLEAASGGMIGLAGSSVSNQGTIEAHLGSVVLASGDAITLDFDGQDLIHFTVSEQSLSDENHHAIDNRGHIRAPGGSIHLEAKAAPSLINQVVNNEGFIEANQVHEKDGVIYLTAQGATIEQRGVIEAQGGHISFKSDQGIHFEDQSSTRVDHAHQAGHIVGEAHHIRMDDGSSITANSANQGGHIQLRAEGMLSQGGLIQANGDVNAGTITLHSDSTLSLAGSMDANSIQGEAGKINLTANNRIIANNQALLRANGYSRGGDVFIWSDHQATFSGQVTANGSRGGTISLSAGQFTSLMGANLSALGEEKGGVIHAGGQLQGGEMPTSDAYLWAQQQFIALPQTLSSQRTWVNSSSQLSAQSVKGNGGLVVVWSDDTTSMQGDINVSGKQEGGLIEISGKSHLAEVDLTKVVTGLGGQLLLDPKNITIGSQTNAYEWLMLSLFAGYKDLSLSALEDNDNFAQSVTLSDDGTRMAIGTPYDDGEFNSNDITGAVYLVSFANSSFAGASLDGTIGKGYSGNKNVDISSLDNYDLFGQSVSFNEDASRLAIGAPGDDGSSGASNDSGAVYLISFSDSDFSGGTLSATLGSGYSDLNLTMLDDYDYFGQSIALSDNASRLVVGAPYDDGASMGSSETGAAYLISFTGNSFSSPSHTATVGKGYSSGSNLSISNLDDYDNFGTSVAINADNTRLAVGASHDAGSSNGQFSTGAVYLMSFSNSDFSSGSHDGTIGYGYSGGNNLSLASTLSSADQLGTSVALSEDATRLVIGAPGDDGSANNFSDSGAIYLVSFSNGNFSGASHTGTIGQDYTSSKDIDLTSLGTLDQFGTSLAINDNASLLSSGAIFDDGKNGTTNSTGANYLFSFTDTSFSSGSLLATMGSNYGSSITGFGDALGLNQDASRLVVGAQYDRGSSLSGYGFGAAYLISFTDTNFGGSSLDGIIGKGYTGGKNLNITTLAENDNFGSAVALSDDSTRLVVGAPGDDGSGDSNNDSGAVYLISFTDSSFSNPSLTATIGSGYSDLDLTNLDNNDQFGSAVAINNDASKLVVGALGDDGDINSTSDVGAVYLLSFSNASFGNPSHTGTLGQGYASGNNMSISGLDSYDGFGRSLALDESANRLAVGAPYDDGNSNSKDTSGSVYLLSFSNGNFSSGSQSGTIGYGYSSGNNYSISTLDLYDQFGTSVAFNSDASRLMVGIPFDYGNANTDFDTGAAMIIDFSNTSFGSPSTVATLGKGYTGIGDINLSLDSYDYLGKAAVMNDSGNRFIIGAQSQALLVDDFPLTTSTSNVPLNYSTLKSIDSIINPSSLINLITSGTAVTLQASNDITISEAISATGSVASLTLKSGRSILINENLSSAGDITLIANDTSANGVVDGDRDSGSATISVASGKSISAADLTITMNPGTGLTHSDSGDITLRGITAESTNITHSGSNGSIKLYNDVTTIGSSGQSYTGDLTIAGNINLTYANASSFSWTNSGSKSILGLSGGESVTIKNASGTKSFIGTMDTSNAARISLGSSGSSPHYSQVYGSATNAVAHAKLTSGSLRSGHSTADNALSGNGTSDITVSWIDNSAQAPSQTTDLGNYRYSLTGQSISLHQGYFMDLSSVTETLGITAKPLTISGTSVANKTYDKTNSASITEGTLSGVISGDTVTVTGSGSFPSVNAGAQNITVTYTLAGSDAANYSTPSNDSVSATITAKQLTVSGSAVDATKIYDGDNSATVSSQGTLNGIQGEDDVSLSTTATYDNANVGSNKTVTFAYTLANNNDGNYSAPASNTTTANINARQLSVSGSAVSASKTYDATNATTVTSNGTLSGVQGSDNVALNSTTAIYDNTNVGTNKTVTFAYTLANNSDGNYSAPASNTTTANITARQLSVSGSAVDATKVYDGETSATVSDQGTLSGIQGEDDVSLSTTATYDNANVGSNKTVTFAYTLANNSDGNYSAPSSNTTTADITARQLSVSGSAVDATKVYDGETSATVSDQGTLSGVQGSDNVALNSTTATYDNANVGTGKTVTFAYTLANNSDGNYSAPASNTTTANITAKQLTVSGSAVDATKIYDGDNSATVSSQGTLSGVQGSDNVALNSTTATYDNANVGTGKTVTFAYTLANNSDGNYSAPASNTTTANINARQLSVSGSAVSASKTYDATNAATVTSNGTLSGVQGSDNVALNSTTATYDNTNVGSNKTVTFAYTLANNSDGNYSAPASNTTTANITARQLSVSDSAVSASKTYDSTRTANVTNQGTLNGAQGEDDVSLSTTATYDNANVGTDKTVTFAYTLANNNDGNYSAPSSNTTTANITAKALTISNSAVNATKVYDGDTSATVSSQGTLSGAVSGDNVSLASTTATYDNTNVGTDKTVTFAYTLANNSDGNYSAPSPNTTTANITAKQLSVSGTSVSDKIYDGNTNATLSSSRSLIGAVSGDNLSLSTTASFNDADAGTDKTVAVVYSIANISSNYIAPTAPNITANITPKPLDISGASANNKTYDASTSVILANNGSLDTNGIISGDDVNVSSITARFSNKNAGTNKDVVLSYILGGNDAANYEASTTITATITPKALQISGSKVEDKPFTGERSANIQAGTLSGVLSNDNITVKGGGVFASAGIAEAVEVTVSYTLSSTDRQNYTLAGEILLGNIIEAIAKEEPKLLQGIIEKLERENDYRSIIVALPKEHQNTIKVMPIKAVHRPVMVMVILQPPVVKPVTVSPKQEVKSESKQVPRETALPLEALPSTSLDFTNIILPDELVTDVQAPSSPGETIADDE